MADIFSSELLDAAIAAGVQAEGIEAGYKQSADAQGVKVQRAIVARGLAPNSIQRATSPRPTASGSRVARTSFTA